MTPWDHGLAVAEERRVEDGTAYHRGHNRLAVDVGVADHLQTLDEEGTPAMT